ncbi:MAG TPA: phage terminase large subunit [Intrasporangium sp.]|uniref:phage terminase large subunit n=1 Tax=Intrasporangium sp. TaxID=1925024 RepID=UPI002D78BB85|nr:phage terminase large subunit [Intrasporangium sp.]HET7398981.1 phage terminase large subunit [Intrasporangium sp.]
MTPDWLEFAARSFEPRGNQWPTPGALARQLNPKTVQTPALDLIDAALVEAARTPDSRLIICMAPQEGKSVRVAGDFPTWLLTENPDLRIVNASYGQGLANRSGRAIRNRITAHPELGLRIAPDNGAVHEWSIDGHEGGVLSVGVGAGVTGRPADLLIIDDPIKDRKEADSKTYRDNVWDWWTDAASARLAPGAPVVLILTRWHHDDLAGRLLAQDEGWRLLNIPAQADHDPAKGETDPLGREPGEFMVSARGRTIAQWEQRKRTAGTRTWASLYQGRPTPDTGNLFPVDGWARYEQPLWVVRDDGARIIPDAGRNPDVELVQSWDFAFKDTKSSDFVVGQVWLRRGTKAYLLDQVRRRAGFSESCQMMLDLTARWPQAVAKLVEDKANGPAILNALRAKVGGLIPVEPEGSKYARAAAVTPLVEAGDIVLPDPMAPELLDEEGRSTVAWVVDLTEEARDFPSGAHDDTVDGMSQANHRLLLVPILDGQVRDADDLLDEDEDAGLAWAASY